MQFGFKNTAPPIPPTTSSTRTRFFASNSSTESSNSTSLHTSNAKLPTTLLPTKFKSRADWDRAVETLAVKEEEQERDSSSLRIEQGGRMEMEAAAEEGDAEQD